MMKITRRRGIVDDDRPVEDEQEEEEVSPEDTPIGQPIPDKDSSSTKNARDTWNEVLARRQEQKLAAKAAAKKSVEKLATKGITKALGGRIIGAIVAGIAGGPVGWIYDVLTILDLLKDPRTRKAAILLAVFVAFTILTVVAIILVILFSLMSEYKDRGKGGITEGQPSSLTSASDMDSMRLTLCLNQPITTQTTLSLECMETNKKQAETALKSITTLEESLKVYQESNEREEAAKLLGEIKAALTTIQEQPGILETIKTQGKIIEEKRTRLIELLKELVVDCKGIDLSSWGQPSAQGLIKVPRSSVPNLSWYATSNNESHKYVSTRMACYLVRLATAWQGHGKIEIGDASYENGDWNHGSHSQHGGGGNIDIWAPNVMSNAGKEFNSGLAEQFAKLVRQLGAVELFVTTSGYPDATQALSGKMYNGVPLINETSKHDDHWHICVHDCD